MTFAELLRGVAVESASSHAEQVAISGLHHDSRKITRGYVFVAMKGDSTDGNRYIDEAVAQGAVAVVSDSASEAPRPNVAWARVAHGRRALAGLSANFFSHPEAKLTITGVTGTNGKTTTTFLLSQILSAAGGGEVVLIGTVEYHVAGKVVAAPHTTPESLEVLRIFAEAVHTKPPATEAVMEVSSHALEQERVYGIPYDVAVFTNLTRDHLDYHGTMEQYFAAKKLLFSGLGAPPPRVAVINSDDAAGRELAVHSERAGSQVMTYGLQSGDFRAGEILMSPAGTRLQLQTPFGRAEIASPLLGKINVYNLLAALAAATARGVAVEQLGSAAANVHSAPGRFEQVECGQSFSVVVDYAHTDDALRNLTALAREFVAAQRKAGRVITLFGCGGDRDRSKRPLMGRAAGEGSDLVVLTSDNPRSEEPMAIIEDALPGLRLTGTRFAVEPDRRKAITLAISEAQAGDIVLIAGKGHERVQVVGKQSLPFDDVEVAREALQGLGHATSKASAIGGRR